MPEEKQVTERGLRVFSSFVRERNVLYTRGNFSELFEVYQEHCQHHALDYADAHDTLLRNALAAFTLHCASRPKQEHVSWTLNFQQPLVNLFLVGDTGSSTVTCRLFTENVKTDTTNSFFQELVRGSKPLQRSYVDFSGSDPLIAAERFYEQSEQRPAKFFQLDDNDFAIVSAHPDYDEDWFKELNLDRVQNLETAEVVNIIEKRFYRFECGCSEQKILNVLLPTFMQDPDALYLDDPAITVNCPRCAGRYTITRETMEAFAANQAQASEGEA